MNLQPLLRQRGIDGFNGLRQAITRENDDVGIIGRRRRVAPEFQAGLAGGIDILMRDHLHSPSLQSGVVLRWRKVFVKIYLNPLSGFC